MPVPLIGVCALYVGMFYFHIDNFMFIYSNASYQAGKIVKQVYSVLPVYDKIIPALLSNGVWNLSKTGNFTPGVPIGPMLAKPTKGVSEIIDKFQDMVFTCEYKYDGERAQVIFTINFSYHFFSFVIFGHSMLLIFFHYTLFANCRYITWRMVQSRYTVGMLNGILGSSLMLLLQWQGTVFLSYSMAQHLS